MPDAAPDLDTRLGAHLHGLRTSRSLTLDALAGRAEVSRAMLSRIERGESSPTAQLLCRICDGLGISLAALFAGAEAAAAPGDPVARRASQPTWRDPETRYLRRQVSPSGTGSPVDIVEIEFPAHGRIAFDSQHLPGADQHVWVLDGVLEVTLGEDAIRLDQGDCLRMRFGQPVRFRNPMPHPIRYAVILSHGAAP